MKDNKALKETYNKIAKDWNKDHDIDLWWIEATETFLSFLPTGASILDIGCAGGAKSKYMSDKGYAVEGIDFSEEMIKDARERFPDLHFEVMDIYDLDEYPKKFDAVFAQAVLLHIPKKKIKDVLQMIKNKLNDGGFIHVALKEIRDINIEEEIKKENDYGYEYERFFSYYTQDELKEYFQKLDLEVISLKIENSGRSKWINIIAKKK